MTSGVGTSVWLDEEAYALLMLAVDRLEARYGQRITSGQAVRDVLTEWLSVVEDDLTD